MIEPFDNARIFIQNGADFDRTDVYRYRLWRVFNLVMDGPLVVPRMPLWIMLNPSTATETKDDPTIRRCIGYSKAWGYDGMMVTNIFALRSTDPRGLRKVEDPIGPDNDRWILTEALAAKEAGAPVICAWGLHGRYKDRDRQVYQLLRDHGIEPQCLKAADDGSPSHPLYLSAQLLPSAWTYREKVRRKKAAKPRDPGQVV